MEEALRTILLAATPVTDLSGTRIWPMERRQGSALPALTYQRISGNRDIAHDGMTGLVEARFQVDAWAEHQGSVSGYDLAKQLGRAVIQALGGYQGTVGTTDVQGIFVDSERDLRAEGAADERLARVSIDLIIWNTE